MKTWNVHDIEHHFCGESIIIIILSTFSSSSSRDTHANNFIFSFLSMLFVNCSIGHCSFVYLLTQPPIAIRIELVNRFRLWHNEIFFLLNCIGLLWALKIGICRSEYIVAVSSFHFPFHSCFRHTISITCVLVFPLFRSLCTLSTICVLT